MPGLPTPAATAHARPLATVSVLAALATGAAAPASAGARQSPRLDAQEGGVVELVNRIRRDRGLHALRPSRPLNRAANAHSWEMMTADYFSHDSRDGTSSATRIRRYRPANAVGEVLAHLPHSRRRGAARRVVRMWMDSPPHRAVLLGTSFRRIGVARQTGRFRGRRAIVFTADLTSKR